MLNKDSLLSGRYPVFPTHPSISSLTSASPVSVSVLLHLLIRELLLLVVEERVLRAVRDDAPHALTVSIHMV